MAKFGIGARVIDLLGRQQVAGTPTAISELFKNAHDAYARNVEVDFYRAREMLVLRDDGVGMSPEDFETRWLTAATDSKRKTGYIAPPATDPDQPPRPVMGEKGIGRLSIAILGRQVLVLTRQKTSNSTAPIVAALIHWDLFKLPDISLGDIEVPLRELADGILPDAEVVAGMVAESQANLQVLATKTDPALIAEIAADLAVFNVDPAKLALTLVEGPDLRGIGHGTHFYIAPTYDAMALDIDSASDAEKATPIQKALLGFTNTMVPGHAVPPMVARFRDHGLNGLWEDLIGENEFFTPKEFEDADHRVGGNFDARGQFRGFVQIYGGERKDIAIHWPDAGGKDVRCGPFNVEFAYVQGVQADSRLPSTEWSSILEKLNKIGGLYIYRDGMRVLPYGDSDYDFLDIEDRRSRKASYYFFSYRRMFGVIDINRERNSGLIEKAGREGFQDNAAYKQFKGILRNFLIQLAAEFFREDGKDAEVFLQQKKRLNDSFKLLERRQKQISGKRKKLRSDLDAFFVDANVRAHDKSTHLLLESFRARLAAETDESLDAFTLRSLEREARSALLAIDLSARISKPRAIGLTKSQTHQWARYEVERKRLINEIFRPAEIAIQEMAALTTRNLGLVVQARLNAVETISELGSRSGKQVRNLASGVQAGVQSLQSRVVEAARSSVQSFSAIVEANLIDFERRANAEMSDEEIFRIQSDVERTISEAAESHANVLEQLADQIARAATEEGSQSDLILEAMETELEDRRERETENLELAQMGQAIGIVHHEFHSVIRSVRANLRRLAPWAERNAKLGDLYRDITESYSHLDSYLSLFAPLNRRLSQTKRLITGEGIADYLNQLLGERMRRHQITMVVTEQFRNSETEEFVSTLFPSFVNIVDNALFWVNRGEHLLRDGAVIERAKRVTLDYQKGSYLISDTGPGVLPADEGAIFESGFSRKPRGSGLGLSITSDLLERHGYRLTLEPFMPGKGATFKILVPAAARPEEIT